MPVATIEERLLRGDPDLVIERFEDRLEALALAHSSPLGTELVLERCRGDYKFAVAVLFDTYNPQLKGQKYIPFLPSFRQRECLDFIHRAVENDWDAAYEKARKVGMSWLHCAYRAWRLLFSEGYKAHFGSWKKEYVEAPGNLDALFPKIDAILERLPAFARPGEINRKAFHIENPAAQSLITGEAMTGLFGSGGRAGDTVMDELSKAPEAEEAWHSVTATASSKHAIATPQGEEFFWSLVHPDEYRFRTGKASVSAPAVFRLSWQDIDWFNPYVVFPHDFAVPDHFRNPQEFDRWWQDSRAAAIGTGWGYLPEDAEGETRGMATTPPRDRGYDEHGRITFPERRWSHRQAPKEWAGGTFLSPWYEREGSRYDDVRKAQELDISYSRSKGGKVYAVQLQLTKKVQAERDPSLPLYTAIDPGRGDDCALLWVQFSWKRRRYQWIREYYNAGKTAEFYRAFLTGDPQDWERALEEGATGRDAEFFEAMWGPVGTRASARPTLWRPDWVACDPAGAQKTVASRKSFIEVVRGGDVIVRFNHDHRFFPVRIPALKKVLKHSDIDPAACPRLLTALSNIAYPQQSEAAQAVKVPDGWVHHPTYSHPVSAAEFFACFDPHEFDILEAASAEIDDGDKEFSFADGARYPRTLKEILGYDPHAFAPRSRAGY